MSKSGHLIFFPKMTSSLKWYSSQSMTISPSQLLWPKNLGQIRPHLIINLSANPVDFLLKIHIESNHFYHLQFYILVITTITFPLDHFSKPPDWSHWFTFVPCDPFSEARVMLLNTSQIMSVLCTKLSNGSPSQNKAKVLQCPTDCIQSGLLRNLWSYLLVSAPPTHTLLQLLGSPCCSLNKPDAVLI